MNEESVNRNSTKSLKKNGSHENARDFVSDVVLNAVEPGVNKSVLIFINVVFGLLLFTVAGILLVEFNILLLIFGLLAAGLMVGLNIFIAALPQGQSEERTKEE